MADTHPPRVSFAADRAVPVAVGGIVISILAVQSPPAAIGPWSLLLIASIGLLVRPTTAVAQWPVVLALAFAVPPQSALLVALLPALVAAAVGVKNRRDLVARGAEMVALLCSILVAVSVAAGVQQGASLWRLVVGGALAGAIHSGLQAVIERHLGLVRNGLRWVVADLREDVRDSVFAGATAVLLGHLVWLAVSGEGVSPWPVVPWAILPAVGVGMMAVVAVEMSRHGDRLVAAEALAARLMVIEIQSLGRRGHIERVLRLSLAGAAALGLSARRRMELVDAVVAGTPLPAASIERNLVAIATAYDLATTPRPGRTPSSHDDTIAVLRRRFGGIEDASIISHIDTAATLVPSIAGAPA